MAWIRHNVPNAHQGGRCNQVGPASRQAGSPAPTPCTQPAAELGQRPRLHLWTALLRCPRPGPGQVRDAAQRPPERPLGDRRGRQLRFLAAQLLPGAGAVRRGWPARLAPSAARTKACSQTLRGGRRPAGTGAEGGLLAQPRRAGSDARRATRTQGASPQCSAGPGAAAKKSPPSQGVRDRASGSELAQAYELLRAQAEGGVTLGTRPTGLAAFLRGGMPQWMATWRRLLPVSSPHPKQPATAAPSLAGIGRELALLLAEMALCSSALDVPSRAVGGLARAVMAAPTTGGRT